MSQKDLALKIAMRRHFWRVGYSTRINVPLRAYVSPAPRASKYEEYTDLDVLGIAVGRDVRLERVIADCKTSDRGSTERMFWLKGVSYFFQSDTAYLVRQDTVTRAARQLAGRLNLSVVTASDFRLLEDYHPGDPHIDWGTVDSLLAESVVAKDDALTKGAAKKLQRAFEYCHYDFWGYEPYRNIFQLVAHLHDVAGFMKTNNRTDFALFADCVWLYAVAISFAVEYVRRAHLSETEETLQEYVFGGQLGLREKKRVFAELSRLYEDGRPSVTMLPSYFPMVLELVTRFSRRPNSINDILRYGELIRLGVVAGSRPNLPLVFGKSYDEIAAKLLGDVAGALVTFAGLDKDFRSVYRNLLSNETTATPAAVEDTAVSSLEISDESSSREGNPEVPSHHGGDDSEPLRLIDP